MHRALSGAPRAPVARRAALHASAWWRARATAATPAGASAPPAATSCLRPPIADRRSPPPAGGARRARSTARAAWRRGARAALADRCRDDHGASLARALRRDRAPGRRAATTLRAEATTALLLRGSRGA